MTAYAAPGVYYERADASPPGIAALRTDIAGFVGITLQGPLDVPVPVQSWRQFQANFGDVTAVGFLAYAVRAFFANGGRKCWVVRVAPPEAAGALAVLNAKAGAQPVWKVAASSPGVWGNDLEVTVRQTHLAETVSIGNSPVAAEFTAVASTSGFSRGTLVSITADKAAPVYRVVSEVDAANSLLIWLASEPQHRLRYDSPLAGISGNVPLLIQSVEYTLLVWRLGQLLRSYEGLSLVPEHPRYGPVVLRLPTYDLAQSTSLAPEPVVLEECRDLQTLAVTGFAPLDVSVAWPMPLAGGIDALGLLTVDDFIGEDVAPLDDDPTRTRKQRGLRALDLVDEVSILAVPDIQIRPVELHRRSPLPECVPDPCRPAPSPVAVPRQASVPDLPPIFSDEQIYQVQATMVARCEELRDRVALLDPPYSASCDDAVGAGAIRAWRDRFDSKYAALYYPWLRVVDPLALTAGSGAGLTRDIPPCGHVAGQCAAADLSVGAWKAPANAPLVWVQDVTVAVAEPLHEILNPAGVNAVRTMAGSGIRVMGARTLSGDPSWRFLNVVRLMAMIEKAILVSSQWAVFEPNNLKLWQQIKRLVNDFLTDQWSAGALYGATPDLAFLVRVDATLNPPAVVALGQLIVQVTVVPTHPAEFVVFQVIQDPTGASLTESTAT